RGCLYRELQPAVVTQVEDRVAACLGVDRSSLVRSRQRGREGTFGRTRAASAAAAAGGEQEGGEQGCEAKRARRSAIAGRWNGDERLEKGPVVCVEHGITSRCRRACDRIHAGAPPP